MSYKGQRDRHDDGGFMVKKTNLSFSSQSHGYDPALKGLYKAGSVEYSFSYLCLHPLWTEVHYYCKAI